MKQQDQPRKLREDLSPQERERAERIGSVPAGQRMKTSWSTRTEKFIPSKSQH